MDESFPVPTKSIEDYGLIGDGQTAALVHRDGSIEWLCWPRFDSDACLAALLGTDSHGRWKMAPVEAGSSSRRRYRTDTLVLETEFELTTGCVGLIDFRPIEDNASAVIRIVRGLAGKVKLRSELDLRFDYGSLRPAIETDRQQAVAFMGPDLVVLHAPAQLSQQGSCIVSEVEVSEGEEIAFCLRYGSATSAQPPPLAAAAALRTTEEYWLNWIAKFSIQTRWPEAVRRSRLTLKAMIFRATGGIIAAPTTSLPEAPAEDLNWDYRYCWLRDAAFTITALLDAGYHDEAKAFRDWLLRAAGGEPGKIRIMYRADGSRRLEEWVASWLPGFRGARPVRIGNAAAAQRQLDVYGELLDSVAAAAKVGVVPTDREADLVASVIAYVEGVWDEPNHGLWELRGHPQHYTYSKVSAWAAVDRFVRRDDLHRSADNAFVKRMVGLRNRMHREICEKGLNRQRETFVDYYGSEEVDPSLLNLPLVGFLPVTDLRIEKTIAAIERELVHDGFVHRKLSGEIREGAFLACTGWLVECQLMQGRRAEAERTFAHLLRARNDLGLLAEEFNVRDGCLAGNFPQALSHLALTRAALRFENKASNRGDGHGK
ncbi:glycoside hydrolase family 15 protein [Bradyrhizobium centrosematis]|uniref:glycoside hydrolase family 15 protein n=1 Tax=Bradyrhizobium centrosematis TaxID=1300039 RepID=UPI00216796EB|nr:glycoside hydrolase family 15 protein [Bradyrhizobium centrosematis]MCS3758721.1 GH15 family glucan-1,4-alpha-glucosidase [Bradyrhizobium centrosematis]MCS3773391.1 GH15 family glucan-1,4-alpha-glucosidase [Bradyrhizobium centrosematis]